MTVEQQADTAAQQHMHIEAQAARDELAVALGSAGVTLPSLRVDPVTAAGVGCVPRPLVDLGCCNAETARALAAVIRRAASMVPGAGR